MRTFLALSLASLAGIGLAGCDLNVSNPSVIDATKFNPNTDGFTLSMSAQTSLYQAFQQIVWNGGLISDEIWTGAIRPETNKINSRTFVGTDDINLAFFAPLSLALAGNVNAVRVLAAASGASSDSNYARVSMNAGYAFELSAESMCASDEQRGPKLTVTQLLDSATTHFTTAISVGQAAGATAIVQESMVGLARAYLQLGQYANATATADSVDTGFVANEINSPNPATASTLPGTLGNIIYALQAETQLVVPAMYRHLDDPRVQSDSNGSPGCPATNGIPCVIQLKYTSFGDPIRLASGLEAKFISAEAQLHATGNTGPALTLIATERGKGQEGTYGGGADTLSVLTELLNQRAREFWMEGKKLGDIQRNPSVSLSAILTDPVGAPYLGPTGGNFGNEFCAPIPPEEVSANPNLQ
jgi:hypothetical protein